MKNLIVFSGIPSSGKSITGTLLAKELEYKLHKKTIIIGSDDIRKMIPILSEKFIPEREDSIRKLTLILIENAIDYFDIVINDDMNYYRSMRHDLYEISKRKKCNFFIIYFDIDLEDALKYNKDRGMPIPQNVIINVYKKFDKFGTYKWDNPIITINSSLNTVENNVKFIIDKLKDKLEISQFNKNRIINKPGISEYYDKITREIVSEIIKTKRGKIDKNKILKIRKDILKISIQKNLSKEQIFQLFLEKINEQN